MFSIVRPPLWCNTPMHVRDAVLPDVGDYVEIDGEVDVIVSFIVSADEVVTARGASIFVEELERIPRPTDDGDLEAWLEAPTFRRRTRVAADHSETHRCHQRFGNCTCRQCYFVAYFDKDDQEIHREHYVDNEACHCYGTSDCC